MERFNRVDNTAPVTDVAENTKPPVEYSMFDLSCKEVGQALPYALIPIDSIYTLPNADYDLNYDVQITFRNPTIRKLLNGFRVYLHAYYNRNSDLWEGWNNFITRGRSGNINLEIPKIMIRKPTSNNKVYTTFTPMSLYSYLYGAPEAIPLINNEKTLNKYTGCINAEITNNNKTNLANYENIKINALKAMMYQRLWRDKYCPKNLLQNNKMLFPDNDDHFILSYNCNEVNQINYEHENYRLSSENQFSIEASMREISTCMGFNDVGIVQLDKIRFRQYKGDRFTTASPFSDMLRGTAPKIDITIEDTDLKAILPENYSPIVIKDENYTSDVNIGSITTSQTMPNVKDWEGSKLYGSGNQAMTIDRYMGMYAKQSTNELSITGTDIISEVKLRDLRSLEVFTIFAERMARTNGDYNEMIYAQFGYNPEEQNREAIYIGGSYQDIIQNSIYQTSESTETAKLGQQVAQGISASYNKLGSFHSKDYGIIMVIMSIVPETIYTTGINKLDTDITMESQYYPIMNNLSAEPILNKELYVTGTESTDEGLYGYAERYSEYKSRRDKVKGFSVLKSTDDAYDSALVMARKFSTNQNLNAQFVTGTPDNVSLLSFASEDEPPFDYAIIKDIRAKLPMPYVTIPQGLGTRA